MGNNSRESMLSATKKLNWTCKTWRQIHKPNLKSIFQKLRKTKFEQRTITPIKLSHAWQNSNLICIIWWQIHTLNLKSISQKTAEKSPENLIWAKGNNSCKSRSSMTRLELELYYVMTISYTKFEVNIFKDCRKKSGKLNFRKGQ